MDASTIAQLRARFDEVVEQAGIGELGQAQSLIDSFNEFLKQELEAATIEELQQYREDLIALGEFISRSGQSLSERSAQLRQEIVRIQRGLKSGSAYNSTRRNGGYYA
ncbi:MAG: hypothetical protein IJ228_12675 [Succinivibrio sp.]|nr:hypothetical protein [Succinivibrio sp.]